ncbi:EAL domain-containing protein [Denitrovibrio acetiphilus]|uniref:EAL domain-containing protein n=1 Tax=Denitrovibrio acetiphilus TaxID=118000 RepID=UPI00019B4492|nr:EAL domain-containing protein [Denitrovibrio acetiphilus]
MSYFFILAIVIMSVALSAPMFLMGDKFTRKSFMNKTTEIIKMNSRIATMILDKKSAILTNTIDDIEYVFADVVRAYTQGDIETFEAEIMEIYDHSFAKDIDIFFFQSADGKYLFDASTPFYDTSHIVDYMTANGRFLREGIRVIQSESSSGILVALSGSAKVISRKTGELAGYLYTGIVLNSASEIIEEIMQATDISEAALVYGDSIIAGNIKRSEKQIIQTCYNANSVNFTSEEVSFCSDIRLGAGGVDLKFYQNLPDHFIENVKKQNIKMGYIAMLIVFIITIVMGYLINIITVKSLYKLVDYTKAIMSGNKNIQFKKSIISEFNLLAGSIADVNYDLTEAQAYMKKLINNAAAPIATWDRNGNITLFNNALEKLSGYDSSNMLGKHLSHIYNIFPHAKVALENNDTDVSSSAQFESALTHRESGENSYILWNITDIFSDTKYAGTILQGIDITEIKNAEEKTLLASKVFDNTLDGIMIVKKDGEIVSCNKAFSSTTGYSEEEIIGKNARMFRPGIHPDYFYEDLWKNLFKYGKWDGEVWQKKKDGEIFPTLMSCSSIRNSEGEITEFISVLHDITEQKRYEEQIKYQATHDSLTGLPNRIYFTDKLAEQIPKNHLPSCIGIMFLDLDRFKNLNDTLGHTTGDKVLEIIAERIRNTVHGPDMAARFSGDEFTVFFTGVKNQDALIEMVKNVTKRISEPLHIQGYELFIQTSAGISVYPDNGLTASELIKNAEIAMYQAKQTGKNNIQLYTDGLDETIRDRFIMESKLNRAIENDEFSLHYQPKIDLATDSVMGMEALLRWHNPELGFIPPDKFIPLSEDSGLILPIGEWVMKRALSDTAKLHKEGFADLKIAINLSLRQFMKKGLVEFVEKSIETAGLNNRNVEFEITENIFTEDLSTISRIMNEISNLNIKFAIDDFGTGYSSIGYLKKMPISTLKIDRSYISKIDSDTDSESIVSSVILMSKSLGLNVVAEGAETESQVNMLKDMGCSIVQGYYYGKPMPYDEFLEFVRNWK